MRVVFPFTRTAVEFFSVSSPVAPFFLVVSLFFDRFSTVLFHFVFCRRRHFALFFKFSHVLAHFLGDELSCFFLCAVGMAVQHDKLGFMSCRTLSFLAWSEI